MRTITTLLLSTAWITKDHYWILPGKIKFDFDMSMGDSFEIRGKSYQLDLILG